MKNDFKLLVAFDGSRESEAILDDLGYCGLPETNVEVRVISVAEVWLPPEHGDPNVYMNKRLLEHFTTNLREFDEAKARSNRARDSIQSRFSNWTVTASATYGSPAWEILLEAGDFKPDMILLGAKGVSGIDRILIGSVAQKIATEADCSVRICRGRVGVESSPPKILIPYDGSIGADEAVRQVSTRVWPMGSEARVIVVTDNTDIRSTLKIDSDRITATAETVSRSITAHGPASDYVVVEGNPKREIVREADAWAADCIFIGATSRKSKLGRWLLGSVSAAVASRANCSVEIVRPKEP
ncbi:MAG: universal stress protein [Acidobacteriota bacterium]